MWKMALRKQVWCVCILVQLNITYTKQSCTSYKSAVALPFLRRVFALHFHLTPTQTNTANPPACYNATLLDQQQHCNATPTRSRIHRCCVRQLLARQQRSPHARGLPRPAHIRGAPQAEQRAPCEPAQEV